MNQFHYLFVCGLMLFFITGCISRQPSILGDQSTPNVNTESEVLSRQHRVIQERAIKDADYHCKYSKLAASEFAKNLIDPGLFQKAYQITQGFKASDHLYTTGQAQVLLRGRENRVLGS